MIRENRPVGIVGIGKENGEHLIEAFFIDGVVLYERMGLIVFQVAVFDQLGKHLIVFSVMTVDDGAIRPGIDRGFIIEKDGAVLVAFLFVIV